MGPYEDILAQLEQQDSKDIETPLEEGPVYPHQVETATENEVFFDIEESPRGAQEEENIQNMSASKSIFSKFLFIIKYTTTSVCIFGLLMLASNYSAYYNIAHSILYAEEMETTRTGLIESVEAASSISEEVQVEEVNTFRALEKIEEKKTYTSDMHSIGQLVAKAEKGVDLGIEITPYENRIVIPKIGKNIPLVDIMDQNIEGESELNDIFMKELENGVIRYPGSALPGEEGNSFIFGHSSNFPWLEGSFNEVFALLDNVEDGDEIIVYYEQKKFTYRINRKEVIKPGDVSIIKNKEKGVKELTVMTCWPIGTTYNRLVVVGELINVE